MYNSIFGGDVRGSRKYWPHTPANTKTHWSCALLRNAWVAERVACCLRAGVLSAQLLFMMERLATRCAQVSQAAG